MKRIILLITLICFTLHSVLRESVASIIEDNREVDKFRHVSKDIIIPSNLGRISSVHCRAAFNFEPPASGFQPPLVVNIQDLHCHPEVQKNIAGIISNLTKKYNVSNIYLEGASGAVDTSWSNWIPDQKLRNKIINLLLEEGRLTGAEYYALTTKNPCKITGLENSVIHTENICRLNQIITEREDINKSFDEIEGNFKTVSNAYLNKRLKRILSLSQKHKKGLINTRKYYVTLKKFADIAKVDINDYHHLKNYIELLKTGKKLKYKNITKFNEINPVKILTDESRLTRELKVNLCQNESQRDIVFISYFLETLRDYCNNKASFEEYNYFCENFRRFKMFWGKYIGNERIEQLTPFLSQLDKYYKVNLERNQCFVNNMFGSNVGVQFQTVSQFAFVAKNQVLERDAGNRNEHIIDEDMKVEVSEVAAQKLILQPKLELRHSLFIEPVTDKLSKMSLVESGLINQAPLDNQDTLKNSEIIIMVTGGFHTEGLNKLLEERNIPYMVITPNITKDTTSSEKTYNEIIHSQSEFLSQTMAAKIFSQNPDYAIKEQLVEKAFNVLLKENHNLEEIKITIDKFMPDDEKFYICYDQSAKGNIRFIITSKHIPHEFEYDAKTKIVSRIGIIENKTIYFYSGLPWESIAPVFSSAIDSIRHLIPVINAAIFMILAKIYTTKIGIPDISNEIFILQHKATQGDIDSFKKLVNIAFDPDEDYVKAFEAINAVGESILFNKLDYFDLRDDFFIDKLNNPLTKIKRINDLVNLFDQNRSNKDRDVMNKALYSMVDIALATNKSRPEICQQIVDKLLDTMTEYGSSSSLGLKIIIDKRPEVISGSMIDRLIKIFPSVDDRSKSYILSIYLSVIPNRPDLLSSYAVNTFAAALPGAGAKLKVKEEIFWVLCRIALHHVSLFSVDFFKFYKNIFEEHPEPKTLSSTGLQHGIQNLLLIMNSPDADNTLKTEAHEIIRKLVFSDNIEIRLLTLSTNVSAIYRSSLRPFLPLLIQRSNNLDSFLDGMFLDCLEPLSQEELANIPETVQDAVISALFMISNKYHTIPQKLFEQLKKFSDPSLFPAKSQIIVMNKLLPYVTEPNISPDISSASLDIMLKNLIKYQANLRAIISDHVMQMIANTVMKSETVIKIRDAVYEANKGNFLLPFKMRFNDNGPSYSFISHIFRPLLGRTKIKLTAPDDFPTKMVSFPIKTITEDMLPFKSLKDAEEIRILGRTVIIKPKDSNSYYCMKLLKAGEYPDELQYEQDVLRWIREHKEALGLIGKYPNPIQINGNSVVSIPVHVFKDINSSIEKIAINDKKYSVDKNKGLYTFQCYEVMKDDIGLLTYLNDDSISDTEFIEGSKKTLHDLVVLARHGILNTATIDMFHDKNAGRRYLPIIDLVSPVRDGLMSIVGAGCIENWLLGVLYPNWRVHGIMDFGEFKAIEDIEVGDRTTTNETSLVLTSYLADYFLAWILIYASRMLRQGKLKEATWQDKNVIKKMSNQIKDMFNFAYVSLTGGGNAKLINKAEGLIEWDRLARQIAFYMGGGYRKYFAKGEIPDGIYQKEIDISLKEGDVCDSFGWGFIDTNLLSSKTGIKDEVLINHIIRTYTEEPEANDERKFPETLRRIKQGIKLEPLIKKDKKIPKNVKKPITELLTRYQLGLRYDGINDCIGFFSGCNPLTELIKALYIYSGFMTTDFSKADVSEYIKTWFSETKKKKETISVNPEVNPSMRILINGTKQIRKAA